MQDRENEDNLTENEDNTDKRSDKDGTKLRQSTSVITSVQDSCKPAPVQNDDSTMPNIFTIYNNQQEH